MPVENEELLAQLQRAAVLARRSRRANAKRPHDVEADGPIHEPKDECCGHGRHGHRKNRNAVAFDEPDAPHGYGNHKCHGGSGRHGQNRVLAALVMQDGLSQKDLAYLLGIRPQSLSEALDRLEENGHIERKRNEEDHRITNIYLTERGRTRASKVAEDRKKTASDIFSVLTEEEKEQFNAIMEKLLGALDEELSHKFERGKRSCSDECCE